MNDAHSRKYQRLILFDIVGTLVHCGPAPRRVFNKALLVVFGTAGPIDSWIIDGKTDPQIMGELLTEPGGSWTQDQLVQTLAGEGALLGLRRAPRLDTIGVGQGDRF